MGAEKKPELSKTLDNASKVGKEAWSVIKDLSAIGLDSVKKQVDEYQAKKATTEKPKKSKK